jgi:transposase, IS30 family
MGTHYGQLSLAERVSIGLLRAEGQSISKISERLCRSKSTVSRELRRNSKATKQWPGGYDAERAQGLADRRRRWDKRFKLARQPALRDHVKQHLAMGWSPAQIQNRLALDGSNMSISHESIYRYIYHRVAQKDYNWHGLLPRRKFYRGRRPKKGGPAARTFENYVSIDERPLHINERKQAGHWEVDLMAFNHNKTVLLIAQERACRKLIAHRQPNKGATAVRKRLRRSLGALPQSLRQSFTYDNGTEFAQHHKLNKSLGSKSYFCHTHSPWQKGGVENAIGRLRRDMPRKTSPELLTHAAIKKAVQRYNNTPRKCLGFLTPNEAWDRALESTIVALQT